MNDLIFHYQQYQEATVDDDKYEGDGDDLEQDEAQCVVRLCILINMWHTAAATKTPSIVSIILQRDDW